jgi:hypothetical protein
LTQFWIFFATLEKAGRLAVSTMARLTSAEDGHGGEMRRKRGKLANTAKQGDINRLQS